MRITIKRLSSGYYRIQGDGPCNWAQPPQWPCGEKLLRSHSFPEASEDFIRDVMAASGRTRRLLRGIDSMSEDLDS